MVLYDTSHGVSSTADSLTGQQAAPATRHGATCSHVLRARWCASAGGQSQCVADKVANRRQVGVVVFNPHTACRTVAAAASALPASAATGDT